jgi:hypothetical protein
MIIARGVYASGGPGNKMYSREQPVGAAFFHIDQRL